MKETIMGVDVSTQNYEQLTVALLEDMKNKKKGYIVAVNPEKIMQSKRDAEVKQILNEAAYAIPDGIGIIIASKMQKGRIKSRVTGVDMMENIIKMAAEHGKRVGMYGGKPGIAELAAQNLKKKYPQLNVVVIIDGYQKDNNQIIQDLNLADPEILFVAMGSPRQEKWIRANIQQVNALVYQGVGGSFDVFSGTVKRAPAFFQKFGLEWFYRLVSNPKRIGRQMNLVWFLLHMIGVKKDPLK